MTNGDQPENPHEEWTPTDAQTSQHAVPSDRETQGERDAGSFGAGAAESQQRDQQQRDQQHYGNPHYGSTQYGATQYGPTQYGNPQYGAGPGWTGRFAAAGQQQPGQYPTGQHPTGQYPTGQFPTGQIPTGQYPIGAPGPGGPPPAHPAPGSGGPSSGGPGKKLVIGALAVAVIAGGAGAAGGVIAARNSSSVESSQSTVATGPTQTEQPDSKPGSVQDVAQRVLPSVVAISAQVGRSVSTGSGVILSSDGVILTNNHVITGGGSAAPNDILVSFSDGSRARAKMLGADPASDIAVIKADRNGLSPITIGKSGNLKVGQEVIAIGSPLGLEGTVTTGIISALNRPVSTAGEDGRLETVMDAIQTDAAINPGNSGGALINANGALIGINSAIATVGGDSERAGSIGLGFAIPVDQAMRIAERLRQGEKVQQASLGVNVLPSSDAERAGAQVVGVVRGGAAEQAGIPKDAIITKVDDRPIGSANALVAAIRSYAPGDNVKITYSVGGQGNRTADVKLGTS
ncbi:S1C family serine protease [Gordonia shandongensis]|uniref:S1C family serine protease n=1 Tax=Gordonia shandongensis TaxID=376351 RepID=UPI0004194231|nr:trypsin-like peptidase domain-containing protein [Gordonia shandongensis]